MTFKNEEDRVLLYDDLGTDVIYGMLDYPESDHKDVDAFKEEFEFIGDEFPGDPKESYYQGMNFTTIIKRKSDDRLFGYPYWKPIAKYDDYEVESNGDEHGFEDDLVYVFLPVREFSVQGYEVVS